MLSRKISQELHEWHQNPRRMPLLIRGARQIGKSFAIESFGRERFSNTVVVNFEERPELRQCFEKALTPSHIIEQLQLILAAPIIPGKTLLFFDEIQYCPLAIQALRYFKEKLPTLHVVAAGSLLEFSLNEGEFSFPVGRVQFLFAKPLSFREFLANSSHHQLGAPLAAASVSDPLSSAVHDLLLEKVREYMIIGGLPAVVQAHFDGGSLLECGRLQESLLQSYQNDFAKYAGRFDIHAINVVYEKIPSLVGQQVKFVAIDKNWRSRDLKKANQKHDRAGLLHIVKSSSASVPPLRSAAHGERFKVLFLDTGLWQRHQHLDPTVALNGDLLLANEGAWAEQFVGQELVAMADSYMTPQIFYWRREKAKATAEVDFLIEIDGRVFPVEVKAGKSGTMRSLRQYLADKVAPFGVRISQHPLSYIDQILSVPLYLIEEIPRIVRALG